MSRGQVFYLHVCVALSALTGIIFAIMKYFMRPADEFSVVNHPLQPYMLAAHVVIAPFLIFSFGWIFSNHVWPKFQYESQNRASGLWSIIAIVPMTFSAYLLQISTSDAMRKAMAATHWISSALFVIVYLAHLVRRPSAAGGRSGGEGDALNVPSPT
jgi:hypothetical protein